MKSIKYVALICLYLFFGCKDSKVDLSKTDTLKQSSLRDVTYEEAKRILDSATRNMDTSNIEVFIYSGEKGYNENEAQFAVDFVNKVLNLSSTSGYFFQSAFCITDSSYLVEYVTTISKPEPHSSSTFYRFYPKTKKILNGVTFEEIKY
jgi:hypothetical protein